MSNKKTILPHPDTTQDILIKGARMHNLKNVDVRLPKNKLIVVTGVSGSGKSSLCLDTLFAEGQRRYAESLSAYARQFLMRMDKPDVDFIHNICPAIAIEQKVTTRTPRSTVGSMTEIYEYLRLLYARIGRTFSPISNKEVKKDTVTDVVDFVKGLPVDTKVQILIPLVAHFKRSLEDELKILLQKGFSRIYFSKPESKIQRIEDAIDEKIFSTKQKQPQSVFLLIDRIVVKDFNEDDEHRLADSIQTAFYENNGECFLELNGKKLQNFNHRFEADGMIFEEPTPNLFSFNNPYGACPVCEGFGSVLGIDEDLVLPDKNISVYEGAVAAWKGDKMSEWQNRFIKQSAEFDFPIHKPIRELTKEQKQLLWKGNKSVKGIDAFFKMVNENLYKIQYRIMQARYRGRTICPECEGSRLRKDVNYILIQKKNIVQLSAMPCKDLLTWFESLRLNENDQKVAQRLLKEIKQRLSTLLDVGLGYLTLHRLANSLSGGESQRIQLTKFLGSSLTDSIYILDEPSIGLHPRDTARLIKVLKNLQSQNNTVVVVEHDEMIMKEADHIVDMGPLAAHLGGEVIAEGHAKDLMKSPDSLTGKYLSGELKIEAPAVLRTPKHFIELNGCSENNLKNIDVRFPLNSFCVVSGVSGSGKSTLVKQTLYPALQNHFGLNNLKPGLHSKLSGDLMLLNHVEFVDQNPIGKSSRSNPATYLKAWDEIRHLLCKVQLSKIRGYQPKHFSFNTDGGRCDTCKGEGEVIVEMQFLADVHLLCETCKGRRFKDEILDVQYRQKNVFDILEMSVDEALNFFEKENKLGRILGHLSEVGLGYIKLGQSSTTLSGGEAQRVKLASFLQKGSGKDRNLFIFDEPTTGLHFHDIKKLLRAFDALIEQGHSVLVVEHNTDVIKSADWVIDIGPEGGDKGGEVLYQGTPKSLSEVKNSFTGRYL